MVVLPLWTFKNYLVVIVICYGEKTVQTQVFVENSTKTYTITSQTLPLPEAAFLIIFAIRYLDSNCEPAVWSVSLWAL